MSPSPPLVPAQAVRKRLLGTRENWANLRIRASRGSRVPPPFPKQDSAEPSLSYLVLSKDRPMQLEACLRSVERSAPAAQAITVVYLATTRQFADGYEILASNSRARFLAESDDFRGDVLEALSAAGDHTSFLMDDDVFFRAPPTPPLPTEEFAAMSLRLGANTTYCYAFDRDQPIPECSTDGPLISWNWTQAQDDFAYPMSVDGSIFRTSLLRRMLNRARFANPSELEEELHLRRHLAPKWMLGFSESCLVSIPANIVSSTHRNRASAEVSMSAEELNIRFLAGERIDLDAMDFSSVRSAHQEVPLLFEQGNPPS